MMVTVMIMMKVMVTVMMDGDDGCGDGGCDGWVITMVAMITTMVMIGWCDGVGGVIADCDDGNWLLVIVMIGSDGRLMMMMKIKKKRRRKKRKNKRRKNIIRYK